MIPKRAIRIQFNSSYSVCFHLSLSVCTDNWSNPFNFLWKHKDLRYEPIVFWTLGNYSPLDEHLDSTFFLGCLNYQQLLWKGSDWLEINIKIWNSVLCFSLKFQIAWLHLLLGSNWKPGFQKKKFEILLFISYLMKAVCDSVFIQLRLGLFE